MKCPYCSSDTPHIEPEKLADALGLRGPQRRVLDILAKNPGAVLSGSDIAAHLYRGVSNGGPLHAAVIVNQIVREVRQKMTGHGFEIKGFTGQFGGYRLTPISPHPVIDSTDQHGVA